MKSRLLLLLFLILLTQATSSTLSCYQCIVETYPSPSPPRYYTIEGDEWSGPNSNCLQNTVDCDGGQCVSFTVAEDTFEENADAMTYYDCVMNGDDACESQGYTSGDQCSPELCSGSLCNAPPRPSCPTCTVNFRDYCEEAECESQICSSTDAMCFTLLNPELCTIQRGCMAPDSPTCNDAETRCETAQPTADLSVVSDRICSEKCTVTSCPSCSFSLGSTLNSSSPELAGCQAVECGAGVAGCKVDISDECQVELGCGGTDGSEEGFTVEKVVEMIESELERKGITCGAMMAKSTALSISATLLVWLT